MDQSDSDKSQVARNDVPKALSIRKNMIWNGVGASLYQGCQWLITIVVVVLSSSYENSGALAFAMASGNVFSGLSVFNAHTFQLADTENRFSPQNYISFRLITVTFAYVLCVAYSAFVSPSVETTIATVLYLLFKADESFVNVLYGIDQKASRMDYMGVSQGVRGVLTLGFFSIVLALTGRLSLAILAMFVPCVIVTLVYDIPHSKRVSPVSVGITKERAFSLFRECLPLAAAILLYSAVAAFARQSFGVSYGEEALGIYAAVATPCVIVQVFAHYLYAPYLVPLAEAFFMRDGKRFLNLAVRPAAFLAGAIAVFLVAIALWGPGLLTMIYGHSIDDYTWMILPAGVAASVMAIEFFLMDVLIVAKQRMAPLLMNALAFALCVAITGLCVDAWYMNGINISLIISLGIAAVFGMAALMISVKRNASK